jgi:hypothetical protein
MPRNCHLKQVTEGKIKEKREVTAGTTTTRIHKQLLNEIKETRAYWNLKEEALVRSLRRTRFGRSYGSVERQKIE